MERKTTRPLDTELAKGRFLIACQGANPLGWVYESPRTAAVAGLIFGVMMGVSPRLRGGVLQGIVQYLKLTMKF